MTKKQLLEHLKNDVYCRIGVSKIHGVGVIAIRDVPKGINPFKESLEGDAIPLTKKEIDTLDPEVQKIIYDFLVVEKNNTVQIPLIGLNALDISFFMNHSTSPNMITHDDYESYVAARNIMRGEELTISYPKEEF